MELVPLLALLKQHGAKITGSYARGQEHDGSDLDIFIPEKNWSEVRKILIEQKFATTAIGQFCSFNYDPILEVSWRFYRTKRGLKLPHKTILGIKFQTY